MKTNFSSCIIFKFQNVQLSGIASHQVNISQPPIQLQPQQHPHIGFPSSAYAFPYNADPYISAQQLQQYGISGASNVQFRDHQQGDIARISHYQHQPAIKVTSGREYVMIAGRPQEVFVQHIAQQPLQHHHQTTMAPEQQPMIPESPSDGEMSNPSSEQSNVAEQCGVIRKAVSSRQKSATSGSSCSLSSQLVHHVQAPHTANFLEVFCSVPGKVIHHSHFRRECSGTFEKREDQRDEWPTHTEKSHWSCGW
ncbi:unnamed protein product [Toxocara canis]|uniref:Protein grainyhead n=1 Tax=Toxocara canis TaxID=6265 RepID=A0A183V9L4_TOXCA|nr:unnamed protein product [Toxocara canis]